MEHQLIDTPGFDDGGYFSISAGYRINRNFAVEASYIDLGGAEDDTAPI